MARAPLWANWCAEARPMPRGELVPVMIITLSFTLLPTRYDLARIRLSIVPGGTAGEGTHGPAESPAMRRILGMSSKVPGSAGLTTSCSLRAWRRCLETDVILGFLRALRNCWSSSEGICRREVGGSGDLRGSRGGRGRCTRCAAGSSHVGPPPC